MGARRFDINGDDDRRSSFPLKRSTLAAAVARRFDINGDDDRRSSFPLKRSTLAAAVARRFDINGDDRRSSFPLKRSTLAAAVARFDINGDDRRSFVIPSQTVDARSRNGTTIRHQWRRDGVTRQFVTNDDRGSHKRDDVHASLQTKIFSLGHTGWSDRLRSLPARSNVNVYNIHSMFYNTTACQNKDAINADRSHSKK